MKAAAEVCPARRRRRLVHDPRAGRRRSRCRGITSTPGWTSSGSGTTGRTRWPSSNRTTAAGRRASTAACARTSAPTSRSDRPGGPCCHWPRPLADGRCPPASPPGRLRRRWCSGSGCGTPSAAGCGSRRTAISRAPSSGRCAGPTCRWPTRPDSRPIPRSPTPGPRRLAWPARRSTSRSGCERAPVTWPSCGTGSTPRCRTAWTSWRRSRRVPEAWPSGSRRRSGGWNSPVSPVSCNRSSRDCWPANTCRSSG